MVEAAVSDCISVKMSQCSLFTTHEHGDFTVVETALQWGAIGVIEHVAISYDFAGSGQSRVVWETVTVAEGFGDVIEIIQLQDSNGV